MSTLSCPSDLYGFEELIQLMYVYTSIRWDICLEVLLPCNSWLAS